jgi:hypothetical protein
MSSTGARKRGVKGPASTTKISGSTNTVGSRNQAMHVVVNVLQTGSLQPGPDTLSDAERELLTHYRSTDRFGKLTIHQVATLAATSKGD